MAFRHRNGGQRPCQFGQPPKNTSFSVNMGDKRKFVTEVSKEVKQFIWTIKGLDVNMGNKYIYNCLNPVSIEFDIGESIGLPSTWKMSLQPNRNEMAVPVCLSVVRTRGDPEAKSFICQATMKKRIDSFEDVDLISVEIDQNDSSTRFGTLGQIMFDAITGDELVIHVTFVLSLPNCVEAPGVDTLSGGGKVLADNFGNLLKTGDNSDFVIKVRKESFGNGGYAQIKVHKAILGARSGVFQRMLGSQMSERETGTLVIEDLSLTTVKMMLEYIYTGKLDDAWKKVPEEMVRAADMYDLPLLSSFLDRRLHSVCTFSNAMKLRQLAKLHELEIATKNINKFIASNIDQI